MGGKELASMVAAEAIIPRVGWLLLDLIGVPKR